ncbi:MAG TPA: hypothetical protein PLO53_07510 [Candidatus Hydrogenedentes bacterium]|nr:hypothetical protein [Candidatus Hydrogenedentota bacterium]HPU97787.1 hypothetical protein [Candidatus Hydrogenedentota bacterium]
MMVPRFPVTAYPLARMILLLALLLPTGCGWCAKSYEERILLVGDSWAQGIWVTRAWEQPFKDAGLEHIRWAGETTSIGGRKASDFVKPEYQEKIRGELDRHPNVDTVHLIIGGNDVLGRIRDTNVFTAWTEEQRMKEWQSIAADIRTICRFLLDFPQVRHVVIAGYDYLNVETIRRILPLVDQGKNWDFGGMTQAQVNQCFIEVERLKMDLAREMDGVEYVHNLGLNQHVFNQPEGAPAPGDPPDFTPFPGGDPSMPMPDACFDQVEFAGQRFPGDGVHPNLATHQRMIARAVKLYYIPWYGSEAGKKAQAEAAAKP